jgi:hypothetical protein
VLDGVDPERQFDVKSLVLGYIREIASIRGGTIGVGARGAVNFIPDAVGKFYGTNAPKGIDVFLRIRPKAMREDDMKGMDMASPAAAPAKMPISMPMGTDTSMKHEPMVMTHDSTMIHEHDSTMHHDSTMMMHHKPAAAAVSKKSAARSPVKKAVAKKPAKKPAAKKPAAKDPHAGHDMKGMKMPADTTKKKNP